MLTTYYKYRPEIKNGDLLQWESSSLIGWLIRRWSKGANHSSQAFRSSLPGLEDRVWSLEALEHGLEPNLLSDRLTGYKGRLTWHPLRAEFESYRPYITKLAIIRVTTKSARGYDYGSLFANVMGRVSADARKYFCSEYVYLNCRDGGTPLPAGWNPETAPRPGDMLKMQWWEDIGVVLYES